VGRGQTSQGVRSALPIIYMTGGNADEWAVQGVPDSIVITKPFAPAALLTALSRLTAEPLQ